jgi:hypothetical protein
MRVPCWIGIGMFLKMRIHVGVGINVGMSGIVIFNGTNIEYRIEYTRQSR